MTLLQRNRGGSSVGSTHTDAEKVSGDEKASNELSVQWFSLTDKVPIGEGRTGIVFAATFQQSRVAVKVAMKTNSFTALDRERKQYRKLEHLQGRCIPRIVAYHYGADEGFNGFMMELLRPMADQFDDWTAEEIASSEHSLKILEEQGRCLQNDLRPANFGKQESTGRVLVLDLEDLVPLR